MNTARMLRPVVWPHADPNECVCRNWPRAITPFTDYSKHHSRCEMYEPDPWVDDVFDQLDRSLIMKSLLAPVRGVNEPIEVTLPRDDRGLGRVYETKYADYTDSVHSSIIYGLDLCKGKPLRLKEHNDLRRAVAIYCREHQPNEWETDQEAVDWFTEHFSEENYG